MIPVTQTKVVVNDSQGNMIVRGNCYPAVIASLLELPIQDVPNIEVLYEMQTISWKEVLDGFLAHFGYKIVENGYLKHFSTMSDIQEEYKDRYYMVTGPSVRGVNHIVIYQNGKMVFDPHPTREGIVREDYFEILEKI